MKAWKLSRTTQCAKCPWRKTVNPHEIPNGYSVERHKALQSTIADKNDYSAIFSRELKIMACHEDHESHCIGWLSNQIGPGNNMGLRIQMLNCQNLGDIVLCGEQHPTFRNTLPQ